MRRLWSNVLISFAVVFAAFSATPATLKNIQTNGDFKTGRQFVFQLTEREQVEGGATPEKITDGSSTKIAEIMQNRLIDSGIESYEVTTSGNDIVKVGFAADTTLQYQQITTYLGFSGSFALVNNNNDLVLQEEFLDGAAYQSQQSVNEYPTVIIPVKTSTSSYEKLIEQARANPVVQEASEEGGEQTSTCPITLLYNYEDGDTYNSLSESGKLNEKTFLTFDATSDDTLYYGGKNVDGKANFFQVCGFEDANGNGTADPNEVRAAFDKADWLENLLNASALDFDVKLIRGMNDGEEIWIDPAVESITADNGSIIMNSTLVSAIAALLIVSLLLVVFYRLGALNIVTTTVATVFLTLMLIIATGLQYNIYATIGYVAVALVSIVSGIIYCNKLKEEAYKGRSLKKANSEASKKSLLAIVDVHIVSIVIGVLLFLLGGQAIHTFASIIVLGSLVSIVLNTLGLKGLMWLSTNTTALTGKYEVFAIESENVPNHMAEEKQKYFGPYADKDLSKSKKPVSIVGLAAFVLSLAGIIASSCLNSGNLYRQANSQITGSEIYISNVVKLVSGDEEASYNEDDIHNMLSKIVIYEANEKDTMPVSPAADDSHARLNSYVTTIKTSAYSDSKVVDELTENYLHTYYYLSMNKTLDGDKVYAKIVGETIVDEFTLNDVLENYFSEYSSYSASNNSISLKAVTTVPTKSDVAWTKVALSTFIAIAILTLYFMLRYKLTRGLTMLIYPVVSAAITLGLFVLISVANLAVPAGVVVALPVVTFLTYVYMILFANKEKEMLFEDKNKDNSVEHREEVATKAMSMAFTPIVSVSVVGIYLLVNFFGFGPAVNSFMYLFGVLGTLVALLLVSVTYPFVANKLYEWFSKVKISSKPRKANKKHTAKNKSAEPEEAIFFGIND